MEQRIEQMEKFGSQCYKDEERYSAFITGVIWADNNPPQDSVNLSKVWHDASEEPQGKYEIICQDEFENVWLTDYSKDEEHHENGWEECAECECIVCWAYISSLLPKGGKKWR